MDGFWMWFRKANARGVFAGALAGLVLVTAWWVWREVAPPRRPDPGAGARPPEAAGVELGLRRVVEKQLALDAGAPPKNPFRDARARVVPRRLPRERVPEPPRSPPPRRSEYVKPPDPPPRRETVTLEFRGLYRGSEGPPMALVHDSRGNRTAFHVVGETFLGFTVESVTMQEAVVRTPGGEPAVLRMKEPARFDLPRGGAR